MRAYSEINHRLLRNCSGITCGMLPNRSRTTSAFRYPRATFYTAVQRSGTPRRLSRFSENSRTKFLEAIPGHHAFHNHRNNTPTAGSDPSVSNNPLPQVAIIRYSKSNDPCLNNWGRAFRLSSRRRCGACDHGDQWNANNRPTATARVG